MLANPNPTYLLASHEPALLSVFEPVLAAFEVQVEVVLSAEPALAALTAPRSPSLAVIDANLPGMELGQFLATVRSEPSGKRVPIVLISDVVTQELSSRLDEGVIDDLIPRTIEPSFLRARLDAVMRSHRMVRELELLRDAATLNAQTDHLTGIFNRETILSMLFRETDRVQRMKGSLCMILFDIDDFGHWNSRLGTDPCDELLRQVVARTMRLLRSYDLFGRVGKDEFLIALPGCSNVNAVMLAERVLLDVFCTPFSLTGDAIRLSACFGIACSNGRSPVVVLREAEQALQRAKEDGPETIQCFGDTSRPLAAPVTFLSPTSGDELLAW